MRRSECRPDCRFLCGYTLIELLFAMGIASVLILGCSLLMRMGAEDQSRVGAELMVEREVRRIFDQLNRDLMSAHGRGWQVEPDAGDARAAWFLLRPMASQSPAEAVGDLCAVSYALREQAGAGGSGRHQLIRTQHDSATVQEALASGREASLWKVDENVPPLAKDVIEFELWPVIHLGIDGWQAWHPELRPMPEAVEVRLVLAGAPEREYSNLIHLGIDAK